MKNERIADLSIANKTLKELRKGLFLKEPKRLSVAKFHIGEAIEQIRKEINRLRNE